MTTLVLDTNALIFFLRRGQPLRPVFSHYDQLLIPAVVDGEFRAGLDLATQRGRAAEGCFNDLLQDPAVEFVPVDRAVSRKYAEVYRYLKGAGRPIPINDVWIAATALVRDASICTCDAHFGSIPLLRIERACFG